MQNRRCCRTHAGTTGQRHCNSRQPAGGPRRIKTRIELESSPNTEPGSGCQYPCAPASYEAREARGGGGSVIRLARRTYLAYGSRAASRLCGSVRKASSRERRASRAGRIKLAGAARRGVLQAAARHLCISPAAHRPTSPAPPAAMLTVLLQLALVPLAVLALGAPRRPSAHAAAPAICSTTKTAPFYSSSDAGKGDFKGSYAANTTVSLVCYVTGEAVQENM